MMGRWEVARGEAVGEGSVEWLSDCRGMASPTASASAISPFPISLARSEPSAGIQQPLRDPSPGPASPLIAGELGKAAPAPLLGPLFCCSIPGRKDLSREATRGNELPARSQTCRQKTRTSCRGRAGQGRLSLPGGKRAGPVYLCSAEAFMPLSCRDCARQSPGQPLPMGPTPCPAQPARSQGRGGGDGAGLRQAWRSWNKQR